MDLDAFNWYNPLTKIYDDKKVSACSSFYNMYLDYVEYLEHYDILFGLKCTINILLLNKDRF